MDLELSGRDEILPGIICEAFGLSVGAAAAVAVAVAAGFGVTGRRVLVALGAGVVGSGVLVAGSGVSVAATSVGGGGSQPGGAEMDDAAWAAALDRNLWPSIRATRLALPFLEASARERGALPPPTIDSPGSRQQSVVVHVASIWGREGGGSMGYNASKAALISLAHEQARELAPRGVRVLSLAPGSVLHPGGSWERRLRSDPQGIAEFVRREIPFGRFGTAEEVGDTIAFLCSARASWIAGACVVVDGGQSRSF